MGQHTHTPNGIKTENYRIDHSVLKPESAAEGNNEFTLVGPGVWITVQNLDVHIFRSQYGVSAAIYPLNKERTDEDDEECLASACVLFSEVE